MGISRVLTAGDWITPAAGLAESVDRGELGVTLAFEDLIDCQVATDLLEGADIDFWGVGFNSLKDAWCVKISGEDYDRVVGLLEGLGMETPLGKGD